MGEILFWFWTGCFWLCLSLLLHSYVLYPALLKRLARNKAANRICFQKDEQLPFVSVIMSVYNEEQVIGKKLETLFRLHYPADRITFYVGSDHSTDRTNEIIGGMTGHRGDFHFFSYPERTGKPGVVNRLAAEALRRRAAGKDHLFLITDASVFLSADTLFHLVKHFRNERIAIVDAHMQHQGMREPGISRSENQYISRELMLKYREGVVWGKMIGPFGGCYVLRSDYFVEIPPAYLVDDFYIAMRVFEKGGLAINDLEAICVETVSHEIGEEYRRKARISAGNFQNLWTFRRLWWPPVGSPNFAFFSHKVIRWVGPFLLLGLLIAPLVLALTGNLFYLVAFFLLSGLLIILPIFDVLLSRIGFHFFILRSIRYFVWMNAALLEGFFKFIKGIKTNVWEPPKRNA
jgi:cellulose synthase/poly-beta-1,6-N-acetylglucosamine synthase-like glycosyltransferase